MGHWRLTPDEVQKIPEDQLALMEFSYILLERRNVEALNNVVGLNLGSTWFADSLVRDDKETEKIEEFTWSKRKKEFKLNVPLSTVVAQDKKFMEHLKKEARKLIDLRSERGRTSSFLNLPKSEFLKGAEIVDLSYVSKDEFLTYARGT